MMAVAISMNGDRSWGVVHTSQAGWVGGGVMGIEALPPGREALFASMSPAVEWDLPTSVLHVTMRIIVG